MSWRRPMPDAARRPVLLRPDGTFWSHAPVKVLCLSRREGVVRIAVTGASGRIGGQVVRLVAAEQQHQVAALSRRGLLPGRWPPSVSARAADYADTQALGATMRDVDTLVFISSDGPVAEVMVHHQNVIRAAAASGVAHIVALSGLDGTCPRRFATRSAMATPSDCSLRASARFRSPGHRSIANSFSGSWPRPGPAAKSGSPPLTAGYRSSRAATSRGAWRRWPWRLPEAASMTSPGPGPWTWMPSRPRARASGAPRSNTSTSHPASTAWRWQPPERIHGGCTHTRRCSRRSENNAGRRSPERSIA